MLKKIFYFSLIALLIFISILLFKTLNFKSKQTKVTPLTAIKFPKIAVDHFAEALRIKTISPEDASNFDSTEFNNFRSFLLRTYPLADSLLEKKLFNEYSILFKWKGSNSALKPVILMAHLDVVPVIENTLADWKANPFSSEIENDTIWGRGAIDDKIGVIGIMESVEMLLSQKFIPERTIYISIGHDEEVGGELGAKAIAAYFENEKIDAEFILDEGGSIVQGMVPGIDRDVALIGVAEKGFVSLNLSAKIEGGHSSMPKEESAIDIIAKAIINLKSNPFHAHISPPLQGFIDYLGPEMPFINKLAFANSSVFSSLIISLYEKSAAGNALVRTTIAPTIFNSGEKDNVIPQMATATINLRILPGSSIEETISQVKSKIDDSRIEITKGLFASEPSLSSGTKTFGYSAIDKTILEIFPNVLTAPNLVIGATDARHFQKLSKNIYRFSPIYINSKNIQSFHGINERIAINDFYIAIQFYAQLIKNATYK